jgi:hypothetical protein
MPKYGMFDRQGQCLDTGYLSFADAESFMQTEPAYFDGCHIVEVCPDHRQEPATDCQECE